MKDIDYLKNKNLEEYGINGTIIRTFEDDYFTTIITKQNNNIFEYHLDYKTINTIINNEKKKDLYGIKKVLQERNIKELMHFTSLDNLESILENGLLSKNKLNSEFYLYDINDPYRLDNLESHISTSITFPNYKYFYRLRLDNKDKEYIVLSISSNAIINCNNNYFFETNAANSYYSPHKEFETHKGEKALENIFNDIVITGKRANNIPDNYPTDPQAEVMIEDEIKVSDILTIYSNSYNNKTIDKIRSLARNVNKDYLNNNKYFKPRKDYENWR